MSSSSAERYPDAARLQRSFQLGFRVGAVVAALALALGLVVIVTSPSETQDTTWIFGQP